MYDLFKNGLKKEMDLIAILPIFFILFYLYPIPSTLVNVIDNYFSTSFNESIKMIGGKNDGFVLPLGVGVPILVIYSILFYGIFIYGLLSEKSNVKTVLKKHFFNSWVFNCWKNNQTISGKTYLKRIIILFVLLDLIFIESDFYIELSENTSFSWSRSDLVVLAWNLLIKTVMFIIPLLSQDIRRINAVFLNNISLGRITFYFILFFYVIIYYDYFLIKLLPNDYPNLSLICAFVFFAIQFYLIVKNSPITDSKQHEG
jgi:hypothetical protein